METKALNVPDELNAAKILAAVEKEPTPREWPEGAKYLEAPQCSAIAELMIPRLHKHLVGALIGYVFREEMAGRSRVVLAKAAKAGGALAWLTGYDFLISFNFNRWLELELGARCALVNHELSHFEKDHETGKFFVVGHDLEEFHAIVRRWGFWKPDLVSFAEVVKVQLELFVQKTDG